MKHLAIQLNPVPWTAPSASVGRKNGGTFVQFYAAPELKDFKEAVKQELEGVGFIPLTGKVRLTFWLWRNLPQDAMNTRRKGHQADATNMQKALEDALQGILLDNDRDVQDIRTIIVEQGPDAPSHIVVEIEHVDEVPMPPQQLWPDRPEAPALDFDRDEDEGIF